MDRVLNSIVLSVCGSTGKYIPLILPTGEQSSTDGFIIKFNGSVDITKEVFIERVFRITAQEIWILDEEVIQTDVPMLVEVGVNMFTAKKEDNLEDAETLARLTENENKVSFKVRG